VCWWWPARAGVHGGGWRKPEFAGGLMALSGCGATRLIARPCVGLCVVAGGGARQRIVCRSCRARCAQRRVRRTRAKEDGVLLRGVRRQG